MQTIQASEFKAKCLALMDKIAVSGETLVDTKKGIPIVEMKSFSGKRVTSPIRTSPGFGNPRRLICPSRSGGS